MLWRHQVIGLQHLLEGHNVVVATGKSLIFQLYALHLIKRDRDARILVFYPLKSLASDQYQRWKTLCREFGVPLEAVAKIDGEVLATERGAAIEKASILLMTPDVCQAWFMRNVGSGAMRRFLSKLLVFVLDETHYYESGFGSNIAFLLRRLISSKRHISRAASQEIDLQIVAATATIADPSEHLERVSGRGFVAIKMSKTELPNSRAYYSTSVARNTGQPVSSPSPTSCAEYGAAGELAIADIVRGIISLTQRRRFIAYIDSRQGTERVAREIGSTSVVPYRGGYEADDRVKIESALRDGTLHGVVATSALELGIDIPDMEIGVNLGVPNTRKAFRQRIGRVGRKSPGLFVVVAKP
jgi:DEAD/DEAH box helicase domain-containing protein